MAWCIVWFAGLFEVACAVGPKHIEGFPRLWPSVLTIAAMTASVGSLAVALESVPLGTGSSVWTGIGALGTAAPGIVLSGEPASAARLGCIGLIVAGSVGLKVFSGYAGA